MIGRILLGATAFCLAAGCALSAPLRGGVTANEVANILIARGLPATVGADQYGDPKIQSSIKGKPWQVYFYDCKTGRCQSIQFSTGYDLDNGMALSSANLWNSKKRYAGVHLDNESDPYLQMDLNVRRGQSTEGLDDNLELWLILFDEFREYLATGNVTSKYQ